MDPALASGRRGGTATIVSRLCVALVTGTELHLMASPVDAIRPLDTEEPETVPEGTAELELGTAYARDRRERHAVLVAALNYGLLPGVELQLETAAAALEPAGRRVRAGHADSRVGGKGASPRGDGRGAQRDAGDRPAAADG